MWQGRANHRLQIGQGDSKLVHLMTWVLFGAFRLIGARVGYKRMGVVHSYKILCIGLASPKHMVNG